MKYGRCARDLCQVRQALPTDRGFPDCGGLCLRLSGRAGGGCGAVQGAGSCLDCAHVHTCKLALCVEDPDLRPYIWDLEEE